MGYKVLNNSFSTLAGSINAIANSLTVSTGQGDRFPVIANPDYTYITLEDASGNIEIVKVTARSTSSDVMSIQRGQDGTTARSWAAGDIVELRVVAALLDMAIAHVDDTTDAHLASAIKNTPAGSILSVTVQAALNELDGDINTLSSNITTVANNLNAHLNDTTDAHDASAISYAGGTGMSATDVEAAIDELATEKANWAGGTFTNDISVPDESYDATAWNGSLEVPTKNAVRDKIESLTSVPVGAIVPFGGTTVPAGYLLMPLTATNVSRTTYAALYAYYGTTWGAGDGSTTFGIPYAAADYALLQANSNVATNTVGQVIAHVHPGTVASPQNGQGGASNFLSNGAANTGSTGGPANLAAGARVVWGIKY